MPNSPTPPPPAMQGYYCLTSQAKPSSVPLKVKWLRVSGLTQPGPLPDGHLIIQPWGEPSHQKSCIGQRLTLGPQRSGSPISFPFIFLHHIRGAPNRQKGEIRLGSVGILTELSPLDPFGYVLMSLLCDVHQRPQF